MNDDTAIVDSFEVVVRDIDGKIKSYRYVANGREFIANERYISALNKGLQPWRLPIVYGSWSALD